ncbi:DUF6199 family natural product biosynthesis protein [Paenibacillus segetis]|uniref:DUF6199 domain-containing protein n=1 Tax=Paenibacillus segetis TaxID=1325360 RepID=A0ABQ1YNW0_9BACL|nr:DUF6199 family natural product biosynthesis protein [Paenibacillus segetis]GGH31043.1 hypothetical protein GCM10008013_34560 [Paenibacillus segetis]
MNGFFGFILLIIGIISAASPNTAWYLSVGWKIKDAEPSEAALAMNRVVGVIASIVGLIILISSCASMFTGGSDAKWEKQFQQRIEAGEVSEIKFGLVDQTILTSEERMEVTDLIHEAQLEPFDPGNIWGSSGSGTISFVDGYQVDLVLFGNSGGIELHPNETENAYRIQSDSLESWIRTHITNNY